jgi:hypothetical protein
LVLGTDQLAVSRRTSFEPRLYPPLAQTSSILIFAKQTLQEVRFMEFPLGM